MKRLVFISLFVLATFYFTGCSSSGSNDSGVGGGGDTEFPSPETFIPAPGEFTDISYQYFAMGSSKSYKIAERNTIEDYYASLNDAALWSCDQSPDFDDDDPITCIRTDVSNQFITTLRNVDSFFAIDLGIVESSAEGTFPIEALFAEFPALTEDLFRIAHTYGFSFLNESLRNNYRDAYIAKLTSPDEGFVYFQNIHGWEDIDGYAKDITGEGLVAIVDFEEPSNTTLFIGLLLVDTTIPHP